MTTSLKQPPAAETLQFPSLHGGFSADGHEYVIRIPWRGEEGHLLPPRPWINVIANEAFGFLVSERGAGYTWSGNSREHRLTPWSNDAVTDPHTEVVLVRDEESGRSWSPLPGPDPLPVDYEARHGFGYSSFALVGEELEQATALFVPRSDAVKIVRLRLRNLADRARRLTVFGAWRLVLGGMPEETAPFVEIEEDRARGIVFACNTEQPGYEDAVAFVTGFAEVSTAARPEEARERIRADIFSGPSERLPPVGEDLPAADGNLRSAGADRPPAGEDETARELLRLVGSGELPAAALRLVLALPAHGEAVIWLLLGEGADRAEAEALVERFGTGAAADAALREVRAFWAGALARLHVATPDPALDLMMNGWLAYQVLVCRLWARSALYQSGGALGFRDQLQDAASWIYLEPERTRAQILLHAGHQFVEGDVLHWWHPPRSVGIRTRFADDLLWLPYVTAFYVQTTGDRAVLAESARFLRARTLHPGEDEAFLVPEDAGESADLYEHCCRAIDRSLTTGVHGLPLFGTGDWNDGMNRVGREGRGETVWMAFFLAAVLDGFIPICRERGEAARADRYGQARERLRAAVNDAGWDGGWYRRGYYDDGTPLGSATGDECRIDALVQAWSVLSGAAPEERMRSAMKAVEELLVDRSGRIVRLLAPPFQNTRHDPGYIKGYPPGVRENGGQYTHAALWVVRAFAELGRRELASELLAWMNPIHRTSTAEDLAVYQVEPYVVAADIYGVPPHVGRGGWSWYTGSAGWMYRVALETVLGLTMQDGTVVRLQPRIPDVWPGFQVRFTLPGVGTSLAIEVRNPTGNAARVIGAALDDEPVCLVDGAAMVPIPQDGGKHRVEVTLGA
jgi:N,N'-diacetylchitobiose phosphorylase